MEVFILIVVIIALVIFFTRLPITIAKNRGVSGDELSTISTLSWLSLIFGVTWFIALALALIYKPQKWIDKDSSNMSNDDLDALEKLHNLKEKGIVSDIEYEEEKQIILTKRKY